MQKLSSSKPLGSYLLEGKINIPYYHGEDQVDNTILIIHHIDNQGLNYNSEMFQVSRTTNLVIIYISEYLLF